MRHLHSTTWPSLQSAQRTADGFFIFGYGRAAVANPQDATETANFGTNSGIPGAAQHGEDGAGGEEAAAASARAASEEAEAAAVTVAAEAPPLSKKALLHSKCSPIPFVSSFLPITACCRATLLIRTMRVFFARCLLKFISSQARDEVAMLRQAEAREDAEIAARKKAAMVAAEAMTAKRRELQASWATTPAGTTGSSDKSGNAASATGGTHPRRTTSGGAGSSGGGGGSSSSPGNISTGGGGGPASDGSRAGDSSVAASSGLGWGCADSPVAVAKVSKLELDRLEAAAEAAFAACEAGGAEEPPAAADGVVEVENPSTPFLC